MKKSSQIGYIQEFQRYFQDKIESVKTFNSKGNNKIFKITLPNQKCILKRYSTIQADNYNRGAIEFRAISYLWSKGFRNVPKPIHFFKKENIATYSFEEGRILKPEEIREEDILNLVDFITSIYNSCIEEKMNFPPERTACLSLQDYIKTIERRIEAITNYQPARKCELKAMIFLDKHIYPKIEEIKRDFLKKINDFGFDINRELPLEEQVISPGDFGFHNTLVRSGKYVFLDFEYFGRDDPVRHILHFLHHDRNKDMSHKLKHFFLDKFREKTSPSDSFEKRLKLADPLVGMDWLLLYLNVFTKTHQKHIKFVQGWFEESILQERFTKAKEKLKNLRYFK